MTDWYDSNIEEGIRDIVKLLRENGINTESSCHHQSPMMVQCQFIPDGHIKRIHDLVWNHLYESHRTVSFEIHVHHEVMDGVIFSGLEVRIPKEGAKEPTP